MARFSMRKTRRPRMRCCFSRPVPSKALNQVIKALGVTIRAMADGTLERGDEAAIARTLESIRRWSDMRIAIQLAHAGRKASTEVPWKDGMQILWSG
jgi:hypothetical protein